MGRFKIELNHDGIDQLLKSSAMQSMLRSRAEYIAGKGGEITVYVAPTRAVAEAYGDNKNNAMIKRMGSA